MTVGGVAMKFKLRAKLIDPESCNLLKMLQKEKGEQNEKSKSENAPVDEILPTDIKVRSSPKKKNIAVTDIDKKKESLIRNFYDSRKHNRNFTKIKG